jgi:hypothetical protein
MLDFFTAETQRTPRKRKEIQQAGWWVCEKIGKTMPGIQEFYRECCRPVMQLRRHGDSPIMALTQKGFLIFLCNEIAHGLSALGDVQVSE